MRRMLVLRCMWPSALVLLAQTNTSYKLMQSTAAAQKHMTAKTDTPDLQPSLHLSAHHHTMPVNLVGLEQESPHWPGTH